MSGRKRIEVDEAAWYRLQQQASRLKEVHRKIPKLVAEVRRQTQDDLEKVFGVIEARQRTVENLVSGFGEETRRIEEKTRRRLDQQTRRLAAEIASTAGELRQETQERLAEHERMLRSEIADERRERRREIGRLADAVKIIAADREQAAVSARAAIADGRTMVRLIGETLPHERYAPRRLDNLTQSLDRAEGNIAQGSFEAALATAQDAFQELDELRFTLEERDRERRLLQLQAGERVLVVQLLIRECAVQAAFDTDGTLLDDTELDVAYWADGGLAALERRAAELARRVREDETPLEADELRRVITEEAPALEEELAEVVGRAGRRLLASQQRVNLAESVTQVLEETGGYELDEVTYRGNDQRDAFFAKLVHDNRNEIVIEVAPAGGDSGASVLRVMSYDHDTSAREELDDRSRALARELRARGLPAHEPQAEDGDPDPAYRDFGAIAAERPREADAEQAASGDAAARPRAAEA